MPAELQLPALGRRRHGRLGVDTKADAARTRRALGRALPPLVTSKRWWVAGLLVVVMTACGSPSRSTPPAATPTPSSASNATTSSVPSQAPSGLNVIGVGPGVNQPPFYPAATVSSVRCGPSPTGRFVAFDLPAGGVGTAPRSVFTAPTSVVVASRAVVKDSGGRVVYAQETVRLVPAARGVLVLSLENVAPADSAGRRVPVGVVNISGDYRCPPTDTAFPGT